MSREVRRVPLDWKHPTEYNPHWVQQSMPFLGRVRPVSRLHDQTERFIGLSAPSVTEARAKWEQGRQDWEAGTHSSLLFDLRYHSADGFVNRDGTRDAPNPYKVYAEDGETVVRTFFPTTTKEIADVYPYTDYAGPQPNEVDHMPDFDVPEEQLGWCLYETVSEGTPTTPVFATAAELIDHLATVGQDYDQIPMRRSAAEALVTQGFSMASMIVTGGKLYNSSTDADLLAELLPSVSPAEAQERA